MDKSKDRGVSGTVIWILKVNLTMVGEETFFFLLEQMSGDMPDGVYPTESVLCPRPGVMMICKSETEKKRDCRNVKL